VKATVLWKAFTAHDTDALERFTRHPRTRDSTKGEMKLADAQHVLALEYGFETWREMRDYVESDVVAVESLVRSGDAEGLDLLLREDPNLALTARSLERIGPRDGSAHRCRFRGAHGSRRGAPGTRRAEPG
jgi:hypothetical protein